MQPYIGPLRLELGTRRAFAYGTELGLTPAQFELALVLTRCAGQVVDRRDLGRAQGLSATGVGGTLSTHVSQLRAALAGAGGGNLIQTVRGVGYRVALTKSRLPASPLPL